MIVLRTTDEFKFGQINTVPRLGTIKIEQDGKVFVEDSLEEQAQQLVDLNINFFFYQKEEDSDLISPQIEQDDLSKKKDTDKEQLEPQVEPSQSLEGSLTIGSTFAGKVTTDTTSIEQIKLYSDHQPLIFSAVDNETLDKSQPEISILNEGHSAQQLELNFNSLKQESQLQPVQQIEVKEFEDVSLDDEEDKNSELVQLIQSKDTEELRKFCKASNLPDNEWKGLPKGELKRYLIKKLR